MILGSNGRGRGVTQQHPLHFATGGQTPSIVDTGGLVYAEPDTLSGLSGPLEV